MNTNQIYKLIQEYQPRFVKIFLTSQDHSNFVYLAKNFNVHNLIYNNRNIIPDINNYFLDPLTLQPTLCFLSTSLHNTQPYLLDDRTLLIQLMTELNLRESDIRYSYIFKLEGVTTNHLISARNYDIAHDLRSEMIFEMDKMNISVIRHMHNNNINYIDITSSSLLRLCDDIYKTSIVIKGIALSYGMETDDTKIVFNNLNIKDYVIDDRIYLYGASLIHKFSTVQPSTIVEYINKIHPQYSCIINE